MVQKKPSVIFANAEIHINRNLRMGPHIREGDQGARRVIRAFLLLISGLSVFAVRMLSFGVLIGSQEIIWQVGH
ncbi:MAG: hypothetical protein DWH70_11250 [Planctomycetota bacterium]|nr:MAG: hypothetical protein DWH70_11250 [Planctomycetota bacterium]